MADEKAVMLVEAKIQAQRLAERYTISVIMHFAHRELKGRDDDDKTRS